MRVFTHYPTAEMRATARCLEIDELHRSIAAHRTRAGFRNNIGVRVIAVCRAEIARRAQAEG